MRKLFTLTLALLASFSIGVWGEAITKNYTFDDGVALTTDWTVSKDVPTGGTGTCEITTSISSFAQKDGSTKYLGLAYLNKSGINITITTEASYDNIEEISLDVIANDNSKPNFAAYIVPEEGEDIEVFAPVGSKDGFGTGGTNKWGSKTVTISPAKSGKLKIVTVASSSGKYAAIDNIKIKYTPAPSCSTEITTQPSGATIALGDANPELSIVATNAASYAWKESSDGTSYDGVSTLGSSSNYTPSVNDAVQTKYYYCEVTSDCDGTTIVKSDIVTVNVVGAISYYTVTLVPAGGTIDDATGWTLNAGNYEKEVAEGSSVTLPTFTKEDRTFKTWRNNADIDIELPITITKDTVLTAVWAKTIEKTIYSWESPDGTPIEVGGTAATYINDEVAENSEVNVLNAGNYVLQLSGGKDAADGGKSLTHIRILLDAAVKTGDKIAITAYANNSAKTTWAKCLDGSGTLVFDGTTGLPGSENPRTDNYIVPNGINTQTLKLTRGSTGTNTCVLNFAITREEQVEEANIATVTFDSNGGSSVASLEVVKGEAALKPADPTKDGCLFVGWYLNDVEYNWSSTVSGDITLVAHWSQSFTVSYYDGETLLGAEDVEANGSPTEYADYQTKAHYTFDAWKNNAAVIINAATLVVTKDTALYGYWTENPKAVVTFQVDGVQYGTIQNVYVGEKVASVDSPTKAGNVFKGWYNGESKFDFTTALASDAAITLDAKWEAADPNHYEYAYNDDIRFDGAYYHTPEGKAANQSDNEETKNLSTPYTLFSGASGITSIIATNGIYDFKKGDNTKHVTGYLKLKKDDATSNLAITIATGYTAVLKIKMGGYSKNPTVTLKKGDDAVDATSGTIGGTAEGKNYQEITYDLTAGTYVMTSAGQTLYMSNIDLQATTVPTAIDNTADEIKAVKFIENGQLFIRRGEKVYTITGEEVK